MCVKDKGGQGGERPPPPPSPLCALRADTRMDPFWGLFHLLVRRSKPVSIFQVLHGPLGLLRRELLPVGGGELGLDGGGGHVQAVPIVAGGD